MINGEEPELMHPHFAGFTGEVRLHCDCITAESGSREGSYIVEGKIERTSDTTLLITELPVGKWTQNYKAFLEGLMSGTDKDPSEISDFKENHTDTTVSFTVTATEENINKFEYGKGGLLKKFKLSTTMSTANMHLFSEDGKIVKYNGSVDILRTFFHHRLEYYVKRKDMLLEKLRRELKVYDNKARFVEEVYKGDLVVSNRKRSELLFELRDKEYDIYPKESNQAETDDEDESMESVEENASDAELAKGYEYLLGMKIWSLTFERAKELRRQKTEKAEDVEKLEGTSPEAIWQTDLDAIEEALDERDVELNAKAKKKLKAQPKNRVRVAKTDDTSGKSIKAKDEWDSDLEDSDSEDDDFVAAKPAPKPRAAHVRAHVNVEKKPPVKKKSPPKKQLISLGKVKSSGSPAKKPSKPTKSRVLRPLVDSCEDEFADNKPSAAVAKKQKSSPNKVSKKKVPVKAKRSACELSSDEEMDDFINDNSSVSNSSVGSNGSGSFVAKNDDMSDAADSNNKSSRRVRARKFTSKPISYTIGDDNDSAGSDSNEEFAF
eukprot:scaffold6070_cov143-Alexandrium_tamarense.AAC.1